MAEMVWCSHEQEGWSHSWAPRQRDWLQQGQTKMQMLPSGGQNQEAHSLGVSELWCRPVCTAEQKHYICVGSYWEYKYEYKHLINWLHFTPFWQTLNTILFWLCVQLLKKKSDLFLHLILKPVRLSSNTNSWETVSVLLWRVAFDFVVYNISMLFFKLHYTFFFSKK